MSVKICIVGCGAIGSIFGAHLARLKDVEVHAYDVWKEHTRAINERGLRILARARRLIVPPNLEGIAIRLTKTELRPGTVDNDVNATSS